LWSIGSAYFCKKEDAADYQSVHLSLTGVRAMIAPLLGIASYELLGFFVTFMLAVLFLLLGVVYMFISHRRFPTLEKQQ
jgi:asparagine N-glycosylation enzyme membrane subunit Stt3